MRFRIANWTLVAFEAWTWHRRGWLVKFQPDTGVFICRYAPSRRVMESTLTRIVRLDKWPMSTICWDSAFNSSVMQKRKFQIKRKVLKRGVLGPFGGTRSIWGCRVQLCPLICTKQSNEMYQMEVSVDCFFLEFFMCFLRFSTLVCLFYDRHFAKWFRPAGKHHFG